jgi:hypothetical protein
MKEIKVGHLVRVKDNSTTPVEHEKINKWANWKNAVGKVLVVSLIHADIRASDGRSYILQGNKYGINFYRSGLEVL